MNCGIASEGQTPRDFSRFFAATRVWRRSSTRRMRPSQRPTCGALEKGNMPTIMKTVRTTI